MHLVSSNFKVIFVVLFPRVIFVVLLPWVIFLLCVVSTGNFCCVDGQQEKETWE
jgi:hypothetical protein